MIEIKFRAWITGDWFRDNPKMIEWFSGFFSDMSPVTCWGSEFPNPCNPDVILMQYTGHKDKQNKEIYEGDIIKTSYNKFYDFAYYIVVWEEEKAAWYEDCIALHHKEEGFKDVTRGGYCTSYIGNEKGCEVIGNIYENPELLKEIK